MPRARRLLRREDYTAALASGPAVTRRHFSLYVRENALCLGRVGVIVSKKTAKRAVDRNRLKRLAREAFRQDQERFMGNDLVIFARRCPLRESWPAARGELAALLAQLAVQIRKRGG